MLIRALAECRLGDIVGHLGLPKKFGDPTEALSAEIGAARDACLQQAPGAGAADPGVSLSLHLRARRVTVTAARELW